MARYDRGYDGRGGYRTGNWSDPWGGGAGGRPGGRESAGERPWVGGYRTGYQGGSGGMPTGGYRGGYDRGYGAAPRSERGGRYGRDYWWIGAHAMGPDQRPGDYDRGYRSFDEQTHPRYSPIGGTYAAMGGEYMYHRPPRPLREDTWFSDWTRWF